MKSLEEVSEINQAIEDFLYVESLHLPQSSNLWTVLAEETLECGYSLLILLDHKTFNLTAANPMVLVDYLWRLSVQVKMSTNIVGESLLFYVSTLHCSVYSSVLSLHL